MEEMKGYYKAAIYVRISKEDGDLSFYNDKNESNSIQNQKSFIRDFLKEKPDIVIASEKVDDGYSGTDFNRPAFMEMLEEIKDGKINCVVVKDLSRFGRNYIEAGRFIEKIFPVMGVRFIAINDDYDSLNEEENLDNIMIPFKNLINDAYSLDISIKIRSQLNVKRKSGEFIAPFAPYGYLKLENNKNKLIIDRQVAPIIRDIYYWRLEGLSNQKIADKLNALGVPSPMEYKKNINSNYTTSFKKGIYAKWSAVAVGRILKNEIYIGNLQQGKVSAPSYKVKKRKVRNKEDWISVSHAHEPIVDEETFYRVNQLVHTSLRTGPKKEKEYLLSGILYCNDCGHNLVRKNVKRFEKEYSYYICSKYKKTKECSSHSIAEKDLKEVISYSLKKMIQLYIDRNEIVETYDRIYTDYDDDNVKRKYIQIRNKELEMMKDKELKESFYQDYREGLLEKEEFIFVQDLYESKINEEKEQRNLLMKEYQAYVDRMESNRDSINNLSQKSVILKLDRMMIFVFIKKILVFDKNRVEIKLTFKELYSDIH